MVNNKDIFLISLNHGIYQRCRRPFGMGKRLHLKMQNEVQIYLLVVALVFYTIQMKFLSEIKNIILQKVN